MTYVAGGSGHPMSIQAAGPPSATFTIGDGFSAQEHPSKRAASGASGAAAEVTGMAKLLLKKATPKPRAKAASKLKDCAPQQATSSGNDLGAESSSMSFASLLANVDLEELKPSASIQQVLQ